jgi:Mg-chelatase subunit ChlD
MGIDISATANVEEVFVDEETSANGTIDFEIGGRTREYPLHIVFCIDTSGSMSNSISAEGLVDLAVEQLTGGGSDRSKMDVAKSGLKKAIGQLSSRDTFGVVSFSSSASTKINPTAGNDTRQAESAVESLSAGGGTSIDAGLSRSRDMLDRMPNENAVEWIVLISDGKGSVPTAGELERNYSEEGIVIQAAGVGDGYDRQQMLELAQRTQGELEDISSGRALQSFFSEEVQNARNVVALGAELTIEPSDIVDINELYYSLAEMTSTIDPEWRGGNCVIDLGDVDQKNPPQVVFGMDIRPNEVDLSARLARAVLRTDSDTASDEITVTVDEDISGLGPIDDGPDEPVKPDPETPPEFVIKKISTLAQEGELEKARRYLEDNESALPAQRYREAKELIDEQDVPGLGKL